MRKIISLVLVFSLFFLGVFQNINVASAKNSSKIQEVSEELAQYLEDEQITFIQASTTNVFSSIYDNIKYELTYYKKDGTFESRAFDVDTGKELDIQELKRLQMQEGKTIAMPRNTDNSTIAPMALPIVLVPVATWVFEHLIAMAIAATLVTVVAVTKDEIKAELEKRLKRKNPTIIYRGGSSTAQNLTPRTTDKGGLSYYRKMPSGKFTATTKEAVDQTKVLKAVIDGKNHVSVKPVKSSEMKGWIDSRANAKEKPHKFTRILQAISVSSKN